VFPYPCQIQPSLFVFPCLSKSVTWYGELIACCKLPDDTQHYSEQHCLFEIILAALVVKPRSRNSPYQVWQCWNLGPNQKRSWGFHSSSANHPEEGSQIFVLDPSESLGESIDGIFIWGCRKLKPCLSLYKIKLRSWTFRPDHVVQTLPFTWPWTRHSTHLLNGTFPLAIKRH
jgi:hypothetical protein